MPTNASLVYLEDPGLAGVVRRVLDFQPPATFRAQLLNGRLPGDVGSKVVGRIARRKDKVFAAATGRVVLPNPVFDLMAIGSAAAQVVARAIARGVFEAEALKFPGAVPSYRGKFLGPA